MKYLIIGDIHGEIDKLRSYETLFHKFDKVIFVGDYMDRGPDCISVMKLITSLENSVTLLGNHEWKYYTRFGGGFFDYLPHDVKDNNREEFWKLLFKVFYRHGENTRYYKDSNIFVSHSPSILYQHDATFSENMAFMLHGKKSNERDSSGYKKIKLPEELYDGEISTKPIVYGHIHRNEFFIRENEYCVDFDCGNGGDLAAIAIEGTTVIATYLNGVEVPLKGIS